MKRYSIRGRLIGFLLGSLLLVWGGMLAWTYHDAREEVDELADERLEDSVRMLMLLDLKRLTTLAEPGDANSRHDDDNHDDDQKMHVTFQIWSSNGRLLLNSPGAPDAAFDRHKGHAEIMIGSDSWHSYAVDDAKRGYQLRVFESSAVRDHLANKLGWRMMQALLLALPALALLMWVSIGRSLKPLRTISRGIESRSAAKLGPINLDRVPTEVQPLVDSLNDLLKRLSHSIDRERAFTADAAHELRTPLAAIKVQAEVALAAQDDAQRRQAISQVIAGVNRTTHLAQQLLLLARLDHPDSGVRQAVDMGTLAAECAARFADDALRRNIDLEVSSQPGCILQADPTTLSIMIGNLIDNGVKYGEPGGHATVTVERENRNISVSVKDDGPGVSAESRARLMDRFFRLDGNEAEGSGLGLSIVAKIAETYHAKITLGEGLNNRGLGVTISFPQ